MKKIGLLGFICMLIPDLSYALCKNQQENTDPTSFHKPNTFCRSHFSGGLMTGFYLQGHSSKIFIEDAMSEYVGKGNYPDNKKAFPKVTRNK